MAARGQLSGWFLLGTLVLLVAAGIWGALLSALCMLTRDVGLFFGLLQTALMFLCGSRIPLSILPAWARALGQAFPLSHGLALLRRLAHATAPAECLPDAAGLVVTGAISATVTVLLLRVGKRTLRHKGDFSLF